MAINKVQTQSGEVLIDLTGDTVTASDIVAGKTAHDRSGTQVTGTFTGQEKTATANGDVTPDAGKYLSKVTVNVASSGGNDYIGIIVYQGEDYGRSFTLSDGTTPTPIKVVNNTLTYYFLVPVGVTCQVSYQYDATVAFEAIDINGTLYTGDGDRWSRNTIGSSIKSGFFDCTGVD